MKRMYLLMIGMLVSAVVSCAWAERDGADEWIIRTTEALASNGHDAETIATLREAEKVMHTGVLNEYAQMLEEQALDTCYRKMLQCFDAVDAYAGKMYGTISYESLYVRYFRYRNTPSYPEQLRLGETFVRQAVQLNKALPTDKNRELYYLSEYMRLIEMHLYLYPLALEELVSVIKEAYDFFQDKKPDLLQVLFLTNAGNTIQQSSPASDDYNYYVSCKATKEHQQTDLFNTDLYWTVSPTGDSICFGGTHVWAEGMRRAEQLWGASSADVHDLVLNHLQCFTITTPIDQSEAYNAYIAESYEIIMREEGEKTGAGVNLRQCLRSQTALPVSQDARFADNSDDIAFVRSVYPEEGIWCHLTYLVNEIAILYEKEVALPIDMVREYQQLNDRLHDVDYTYWYMRQISTLYFQEREVPGYEHALEELVDELTLHGMEHVSWDMVCACFDLSHYAQSSRNFSAASRAQLTALRMLEQLVGRDHMLFKMENYYYACMALQIPSHTIETLDGMTDVETFINRIEQSLRGTLMADYGYRLAADYYGMMGDLSSSAFFDQQALEAVRDSQKGMPDTYRRSDEMNALYNWIQTLSMVRGYERIVENETARLEKLYYKYPSSYNVMEGLYNYYTNKRQWAKAEKIINRALDLYEENNWSHLDGEYVQILQLLSTLYANGYADADRMQRVGEHMRELVEFAKRYSNYKTYLPVLQTLCILYGNVNSGSVLHLHYLREYYDAAQAYYKVSREDVSVYYLYVADACNMICNTLCSTNMTNQHEVHDLMQLVRTDILPEIERREQDYAELLEHGAGIQYYVPLLSTLTMAYGLMNEEEKMKEAGERLREYDEFAYNIYMMAYYFRHGDFQLALPYISALTGDTSAKDIEKYMTGTTKIFSYMMAFFDRLAAQNWKGAEIYAEGMYDATSEYLAQNLDYFTQAEIESILQKMGVGGMPILMLNALHPKPSKRHIEMAYDIQLKQKGLQLRKANQLRNAIMASGNAELLAALDTVQQLQRELLAIDQTNILASLDPAIVAKHETLTRLDRYLARETHDMAERKDETETWRDVKKSLRAGEAAIEYVCYEDIAYALVLTAKSISPTMVPLLTREEMHQLRELLNSDAPLEEQLERLYGSSSRLYQQLWSPIFKHLDGIRTVYISPSDVLNLISFQALHFFGELHLMDLYDVHQLTSTALLTKRNKQQTLQRPKEVAVYGAIYYNSLQRLSEARVAQLRAQNEPEEVLLAVNRSPLHDAFPFLKNTLFEADGIYGVLDQMGVQATEKIGDAPSENELRSLSGHSPDIIHLATHGFFYSDPEQAKQIPFFRNGGELNAMTCSGVALANAEPAWLGHSLADSKEDNILTSSEVSELDLRNTKLVVLSACQTGLGSTSADGVFGLQRGFKQAGVESICASLWSVADRATSDMMQAFYTYWISGHMTMHAAMKRAMQEQRERTPSPYFWAPFVLLDAIE